MCRLVPRQVGSAPVCGAGISLLLPLLWPLLQWCVLCACLCIRSRWAPGVAPWCGCCDAAAGAGLGLLLGRRLGWARSVHSCRLGPSEPVDGFPVVGPCLRVAGVVDVLVVWVGSQTQQLQWCAVAAWCLHWHGARCAGVPRCRPPCLLCLRCSARLVGCCGPELLVGVGSESGGSGEYCGGGWLLGSAPGLGCCCLVLRALSAAAAPVLLSAFD